MKYHLRFYLLFTFFTLLFLFYPGSSHTFSIFAFNRDLLNPPTQKLLPNRTLTIARQVFPTSPQISAAGAYVVDMHSFSPVYALRAHNRFSPASTTKILTALVANDLYKPDDVITVKDTGVEGQTMGLFQGEKITVEYLLYGLLVHSGNDAAYALADEEGRSPFVYLMNQKAKALHMSNSSFQNPAGLDAQNQYTSPFDLALAGRELLKNKYLAKIVSTKEITISDTEYKYFHRLSNVNRLLGELQGVGGLKTGYTEEAGENLVTFYKKDGHEFLIVLMKSEDRFEDTKAVVEWIDSNVTFETVEL